MYRNAEKEGLHDCMGGGGRGGNCSTTALLPAQFINKKIKKKFCFQNLMFKAKYCFARECVWRACVCV